MAVHPWLFGSLSAQALSGLRLNGRKKDDLGARGFYSGKGWSGPCVGAGADQMALHI